ncbi:hypothetical protein PsorP6_000018 [Peronosclerospora sorghi]|uniref:Uncharacterized protein n=1 Tax=Peronosclerospora sorghi TaxID=230839 RepID=A0ACC0WWV9_9STRA|nr:hypothetical protein PsorP6_000018 [Peronosclerospora sorghi]
MAYYHFNSFVVTSAVKLTMNDELHNRKHDMDVLHTNFPFLWNVFCCSIYLLKLGHIHYSTKMC